jgi:hypothetical protein
MYFLCGSNASTAWPQTAENFWQAECRRRRRCVIENYDVSIRFRDVPAALFGIVANAEGNRQPYKEHVHQQALDESCELERAPKVKR